MVRRGHIKTLDAFDAAAMPLAVGIVIGRIGDLIIGDHLGKPTSWLLAWQYHGGNLAGYRRGAHQGNQRAQQLFFHDIPRNDR